MQQRAMIAMALACNPKILVADEPTTALDVTIQKEIMDLLARLRRERGMSIVLITHNFGIIANFADKVAVMWKGRIVESGPTRSVFGDPQHPYTQGLIGSMPRVVDGRVELNSIPGQVPRLDQLGSGCAFAERCQHATDRCSRAMPPQRRVGVQHEVVCWHGDGTPSARREGAAV